MAAWEAVIGLEVHAQLLTRSKAFCPVENAFGAGENTRVGPVSGGLPGALPVLNAQAVELAVRAGLALNCVINKRSIFSRKNYFYPDLPKGYQISQFDEPICGEGWLDIGIGDGPDSKNKRIRLQRIHMEEDAGKSMHHGQNTLVNLNRSGVPLVEIVSQPDMRSPQEASAYLRKLHAILLYAQVCDGNLEEGNFRCDANVSVRPLGESKLGTRTELKNINSFKFIEKALEYEIARQVAMLEGGGRVVQETRGWDSAVGKTFTMRSKEDAHDYRYFPDPDLPPLVLPEDMVARIRAQMPELPEAKRARFVSDHGLSEYDAQILTTQKALADYFENCVQAGAPAKLAANWIQAEVLRELKTLEEPDISKSPVSATQLAGLIKLIAAGTISGKIAKEVFQDMYTTRQNAEDIVQSKGLLQVSDMVAIEKWVDEVIAAHPGPVAEYRAGKQKTFGFLVGQVMKVSGGKGNPNLVGDILRKKL